jgi:hypothetical protein
VADKRAFVAEVYTAMNDSGKGGDLAGKLNGELKNLKIDGDKATATLVTADGEEELDFRKTAEGWKMHIDIAKLSAKARQHPAPLEPPAEAEVDAEAVGVEN